MEALPRGHRRQALVGPVRAGEFMRLLADLDGNLDSPMLVGSRIAFLSDHEGWGNLYSVGLDGAGLTPPHRPRCRRRARVLRPARGTDGERVVYESAGELWILESLGAVAAAARRPAGRPAHRPRAAPRDARSDGSARCAGHGPGGRASRRPRHRAPADPPRRPGPRAARRTRGSGAAGARRWAATGRSGSTTRRARTRCASPRWTRAPTARPERGSARARWAGCGAGAVPGRRGGRHDHARRAAAAAGRPVSGELRELARGADGEIVDAGLVARQRLAGLLRPGGGPG